MENFNPFEKLDKQWALVTSGDQKKSNAMTVSWGGMGTLWYKSVVYIFIRDSRYTKSFIDLCDTFSLSFFDESYRNALTVFGSESGRNCDKWTKTGLTPVSKNNVVYPKEAQTVFLCKKMAAVPITKESFISPEIDKDFYLDKDYHTMYIGEVLEIIES